MKKILFILAVAIILAYVVFFMFNKSLPRGSDTCKFDSTNWKSEENVRVIAISERQKMLKDLIVNILPGKSKTEIRSLLGEPLDTPYFRSRHPDMIYLLGNERGSYFGRIDSEWLLIWLDEKGDFKKCSVVTD